MSSTNKIQFQLLGFLSFMIVCLLSTSSFAHDYKLGDLTIIHPQARVTPPGAPVSAGYLTILNAGSTPDRLVSVSVGFADKTEIHEMEIEDGIMRMRPLVDGVEIPANGEVQLMPGGHHIMFMKLSETLVEGEKRKGTLIFEKAGEIEVNFNVEHVKPMKHKMKK